jgi:hypothetical protein
MSSINSRVPPSRIAAIDSPADGEVAAYQASSGQFEWVANGSGGGGSVTSVALTESGNALTITGSPITGAGTFNIAGAGTSSQVILGDLTLGTLTSGTVTSVSSSQAFITIATPTTTPSISIGNASASATGVLTATDWTTFNSKGSGTVTSVALTETGSALTITGSPVTGSGTFNIAGAGTSSQVILGDLSLGTLTSGTVTGTGAANQVSYWTAASVQAGSTGLTYDPSTGNLTVGGYVETGTKVTTPSGTNLELVPGGASSGSIVIADGANGQISITPNGSGTIKLDGVNLDNSAIATGYVLKATSTTSAGWAAESSGGSSLNQAQNPNKLLYEVVSSQVRMFILNRSVGFAIVGVPSTSDLTRSNYDSPTFRAFIAPKTGNIASFFVNVATASATTNFLVGIYSSGSNGLPDSLLGSAVMDCSSTGEVQQTTITGTISLTQGEQYYYASVRNNTSGDPRLRCEDKDSTPWTANQARNMTSSDFLGNIVDLQTSSANTLPSSVGSSQYFYPAGNSTPALRLGVTYS